VVLFPAERLSSAGYITALLLQGSYLLPKLEEEVLPVRHRIRCQVSIKDSRECGGQAVDVRLEPQGPLARVLFTSFPEGLYTAGLASGWCNTVLDLALTSYVKTVHGKSVPPGPALMRIPQSAIWRCVCEHDGMKMAYFS